MDVLDKRGNYNFVLNSVKEIFRKQNPDTMAKMSNSHYDNNTSLFHIKFMNTMLYVSYPDAIIYKSSGENLNEISLEILVIRFLINATPIPQTKKYITFKEIDGGHVYYSTFKKTVIDKLTKIFENNIETFDFVMKEIGAIKIKMGDSAYKIRFLNDTYVVYVVWYGDDEVKASSNVLFDFNIKYYFNAEDVAVIGDIPLVKIENIIK